MPQKIKVAETYQLAPGRGHIVRVKGRDIALFQIDGAFYALDNRCSHSRGPLGEGRLHGFTLTCPWHGAQFKVTDGKCIQGPATTDIATYAVKVEGQAIYLELP